MLQRLVLLWPRIKQIIVDKYKIVYSSKYLLYTNTLSFIALSGLGDVIRQRSEMYINKQQKYDVAFTLRMMAFGIICGPKQHFWYTIMDRFIVKGSIHRIVAKKIVADQLLFSPCSIVIFFTCMGFMEGRTIKESKKEIKEKFVEVYIADCSLWPAAQSINFYLVPPHLRVTYINFVNLTWNIFLSYTKNKLRSCKVETL